MNDQVKENQNSGGAAELSPRPAQERGWRLTPAAAVALYALAQAVAEHFKNTDAPLGEQARAALALVEKGHL